MFHLNDCYIYFACKRLKQGNNQIGKRFLFTKKSRMETYCNNLRQVRLFLGKTRGLANVLCWSRSDIDSLNRAHLDYICGSKLFSGLSQRQTMVENVDNWGKRRKKKKTTKVLQ